LARRFAEVGFHAVAFDYYARTAGRGDRSEAFDYVTHWKQATSEGVDADVRACAAHLRAEGITTLFTVGFCFGGGNSWRQAAVLDGVSGSIGFYGRPDGVLAVQDSVKAPLLLLLGGADQMIDPSSFDDMLGALNARGIETERKVYEGAPHSFFDRSFAEHADACADAWTRILAFTDRVVG
jgi:carboxymethylenebutenolidase